MGSRQHLPASNFLCFQDQIYPPSEMASLMAVSDYVVMATPYTPATHQMVDAEALSAMKPNAVFINIGRGKCVDEEALIKGEDREMVCTRGFEVKVTCSTRVLVTGWARSPHSLKVEINFNETQPNCEKSKPTELETKPVQFRKLSKSGCTHHSHGVFSCWRPPPSKPIPSHSLGVSESSDVINIYLNSLLTCLTGLCHTALPCKDPIRSADLVMLRRCRVREEGRAAQQSMPLPVVGSLKGPVRNVAFVVPVTRDSAPVCDQLTGLLVTIQWLASDQPMLQGCVICRGGDLSKPCEKRSLLESVFSTPLQSGSHACRIMIPLNPGMPKPPMCAESHSTLTSLPRP